MPLRINIEDGRKQIQLEISVIELAVSQLKRDSFSVQPLKFTPAHASKIEYSRKNGDKTIEVIALHDLPGNAKIHC